MLRNWIRRGWYLGFWWDMELHPELVPEQLLMLQQYAANKDPWRRCACLYTKLPVRPEKERSFHHWSECLRYQSLLRREEPENLDSTRNPWESSDDE